MHKPSRVHIRESGPIAEQAEAFAFRVFTDAGWRVQRPKGPDAGIDLLMDRQGASYAVEIKASREGRSDRLIQLWSQAWLQAQKGAGSRQPLAVVVAPKIPIRAAQNVLRFVQRYVPNAAAGVMDFNGLRLFQGLHLEDLNAEGHRRVPDGLREHIPASNLFSDLNQWMLKVLLAPGLPEHVLAAPRERYRNALQLAKAAAVSPMSAHRFVKALERDGFLHESSNWLELVRREELFRAWQSSVSRRVREVPMRFLLRGNPRVELKRMLGDRKGCLALFAAAEALHLGFVEGVPPHVYVQQLGSGPLPWPNVVRAGQGESPDFILAQPLAPQSVFRGAVAVDGILVSDILQVWLDSASHPSRGREQADLIHRRIIKPLIHGSVTRA